MWRSLQRAGKTAEGLLASATAALAERNYHRAANRCCHAMAFKPQVRKTASWPRSWANFSLLWLYSYWNAWSKLHLLGQPDTFPVQGELRADICCGLARALLHLGAHPIRLRSSRS
jgi:hypothetical protein